MKLDIRVDGSLEIMHILSFLPILKKYWLPWQQIGLKQNVGGVLTGRGLMDCLQYYDNCLLLYVFV
jgi:hypothetical protein